MNTLAPLTQAKINELIEKTRSEIAELYEKCDVSTHRRREQAEAHLATVALKRAFLEHLYLLRDDELPKDLSIDAQHALIAGIKSYTAFETVYRTRFTGKKKYTINDAIVWADVSSYIGRWHWSVLPQKTTEEQIIRHKMAVAANRPAGYFRTPDGVAANFVDHIVIPEQNVFRVLEPSAGDGQLVRAMTSMFASEMNDVRYQIDAVELNDSLQALMRLTTSNAHNTEIAFIKADFEDSERWWSGEFYDAIVMNPPYERGADFRHLAHAAKFLKPKGTIYMIASVMFLDKYEKKLAAEGLRGAKLEEFGKGAFAESGTQIDTAIYIFEKEAVHG